MVTVLVSNTPKGKNARNQRFPFVLDSDAHKAATMGSGVSRKHKDAWTGQLPTRFVMLLNELPGLRDNSPALANRFVRLLFEKSFLGREDPTLADRIIGAEMMHQFRGSLLSDLELNAPDLLRHLDQPRQSRARAETIASLIARQVDNDLSSLPQQKEPMI